MVKFVVIIIFVGLVVISIYVMWIFEFMDNGCYIYYLENDVYFVIWIWVVVSFYFYILLVLIFIFNVLIFIGICLKRFFKFY